MNFSKSYLEREHSLFLLTLRKKVISKICQLLICCQSFWYIALCEKIAIVQRASILHDILSIVTIAKPHNRKVRSRWRPDSTRVISMILSQFRATNQTHKVWPNMDTSPLNEWHTHTDIGLVGISAWRRAPSRGTGSLTYHGTPVPHRTCITTHTRFHTSHDRAPTTLRACRSLNEPRR